MARGVLLQQTMDLIDTHDDHESESMLAPSSSSSLDESDNEKKPPRRLLLLKRGKKKKPDKPHAHPHTGKAFLVLFLIAILCVIGLIIQSASSCSPFSNTGNVQVKNPATFASRYSLQDYSLPKNLYSSDYKPSQLLPFIFFHQRKAGGSTMRSELMEAARNINATFYIPCKKGVHCETYHTPMKIQSPLGKNPSTVYGGHLYYTSFMRTLNMFHTKQRLRPIIQHPNPQYTCFTTFREPISRIQSCWNFRMAQGWPIPHLASLSAEEIRSNLGSGMSVYREGCLNEPMRIFSDIGNNEYTVNHLKEQSPTVIELAMNQTIHRASHCVVGVLERCEETKIVLQKYLPFMAPYFSCNRTENAGKVQKGALSKEQTRAIRDLAVYEDQVYQLANELLDIQLQD